MARVLIVDDDQDVVQAGRLVLEKEGHEVSSAGDRKGGMKAVSDFKPDLLILDVMMEQPDDGIAMAQQLRREGFKKPILMLTSLGRAAGVSIAKDKDVVPVDDYEEKPIEPAALVKKVKELLSR